VGGVSTKGLPPGYGENTLVLLVQKTNVLFAYWEISQAVRQFLKEKHADIRLCRLTKDRYIEYLSVSPAFPTGNFYFEGVISGDTYRCELGWWDNGEFHPLLCSQPVIVPSGTITVKLSACGKRKPAGKETALAAAGDTVGVSSGVARRA
jgi:hypothetical protein